MPPRKKKKMVGTGITATAAAADAAATPTNAAAAPPIEPYFGANGEATSTSLPHLPGFETFRGANSATAPPLLSSAVQSTARGRSGSVLSFLTSTPSIRRTTNTATTPSSIRKNELLTPSSMTTEGGEEGRQLICVVKKGERFVCQPFPLCGSVRILITRM